MGFSLSLTCWTAARSTMRSVMKTRFPDRPRLIRKTYIHETSDLISWQIFELMEFEHEDAAGAFSARNAGLFFFPCEGGAWRQVDER